jgi:hypothetical protein
MELNCLLTTREAQSTDNRQRTGRQAGAICYDSGQL